MDTLKEAELDLIWVKLKSGPLSLLRSLLASVIDDAMEVGGDVLVIAGPMVQICFGSPLPTPDAEGVRHRLVNLLHEQHGHFLSIVHGRRRWPVGHHGGTSRFTYGPLSPEMNDWYERLFQLEPGEVLEL